VATDAALPPEAASALFEVRTTVRIDAMGEKDDGYEGAIWVIGGPKSTACGGLYATFGPTGGKGSVACPCKFGFGVQCGTGADSPISSKEHTHEFGTTLVPLSAIYCRCSNRFMCLSDDKTLKMGRTYRCSSCSWQYTH
jgi:hypothetical protein